MLKDEPKTPEAAPAAQPPPREVSLMAMLGWVMMGLAIWHFTIFLPDRFWGGIVGAFVGSLFGAVDRRADHLARSSSRNFASRAKGRPTSRSILYAVPGALIGIALVYLEGMRRERAGRRRPRAL